MNINFEEEFINNINININVTDKYLDEYLQTSRYNLLLFNNLNNELYTLQNNHIINKNKHLFHFVDNFKKETLQYQLKQLILKQRKSYKDFIHYYNTTHNTTHTTSRNTNTNTNTLNSKPTRTSNLKSIENTRELKIQQNLLHSNSIVHKIYNILTENTDSNTQNADVYNIDTPYNAKDTLYNAKDTLYNAKEPSIRNTSTSRMSVDSKRSTFTISSRKSTDSNKSSDSNTSKKSYKINRPDKGETQADQKKMKFTKFFIKK
jgi:hypothetical protein